MCCRFSSEDLTPKQLAKLGEPLIEVTLNAGDLLYMPRGFVHQVMARVLRLTTSVKCTELRMCV